MTPTAVSPYNPAPLSTVLGSLQDGALAKIIEQALAAAATAACTHKKTAEVSLVLKIKPAQNSSSMVEVAHKMKSTQPTMFGDKQETVTGAMPMFTSREGNLSTSPHKQRDFVEEAHIVSDQ